MGRELAGNDSFNFCVLSNTETQIVDVLSCLVLVIEIILVTKLVEQSTEPFRSEIAKDELLDKRSASPSDVLIVKIDLSMELRETILESFLQRLHLSGVLETFSLSSIFFLHVHVLVDSFRCLIPLLLPLRIPTSCHGHSNLI